eukprot:scaffold16492_cov73-Cyclotella_meneghiniana.AAC.2
MGKIQVLLPYIRLGPKIPPKIPVAMLPGNHHPPRLLSSTVVAKHLQQWTGTTTRTKNQTQSEEHDSNYHYQWRQNYRGDLNEGKTTATTLRGSWKATDGSSCENPSSVDAKTTVVMPKHRTAKIVRHVSTKETWLQNLIGDDTVTSNNLLNGHNASKRNRVSG